MEPLQSSSIASIISHASHLLQFGQIGAFELLQMAPEISVSEVCVRRSAPSTLVCVF